MVQTYAIPTDADEQTLIGLHDELLALNPGIRVMQRWGDATEYTVKIKKREAEQIGGMTIAGSHPWRLSFGMSREGYTIDLQVHDGDEWQSAFAGDPNPADAADIIDRAVMWLDANLPVARALVTIDRLLLYSRLDIEGLRAYALRLEEESGLSRVEIARRLDVTQQAVGQALNLGGAKYAGVLLNIVRELTDEEWVAQTIYRRL